MLHPTSPLFIYYNALILNHLANGHKFRVIFGLEFFIFGSPVQSIREIGFPGNLLICPNESIFSFSFCQYTYAMEGKIRFL